MSRRRLAPILVCLMAALLAFASPGRALQDAAPGGDEAGLRDADPRAGAPGDTPAALPDLAKGVALYRDGEHRAAREVFAALAEAERDPARRAVLHANAGTAAARAEQLGLAVWHLRKALADAPRDPVARRNLALVEARLDSSAARSHALSATLRRLPLMVTSREAATLCGVVGLLALLMLAGWRARLLPRGWAWAALVVALLDVGFLWASATARQAEARRAVVLESAVVRGEPEVDGRVVLRLAPGTRVRLEDARGGWSLVETDGGGRGWMPSKQVR